jgi:enterochelin esterase-like enzyme
VSEPLQGFLLDDRLFSPVIGESYRYRVYLPPDYLRSPTRRYPVLYMLHGNGGNYTEWTDSFLPEQADRMIVAGEIAPLIIVMPDDGESTYWANWSDGGPRWADYVADDLVSVVDLRYRTRADPRGRAVGGMSMGGLGALNLAFQRPDVFGVVGGHSPSVRLQPDPALWFLVGDNFWEHNPVWLAQHRPGIESVRIWLDAGTDDVWLPNIKAVHDALVDRGLEPSWNTFPGPHEAEYWIEHIPDYLRFYSEALRG